MPSYNVLKSDGSTLAVVTDATVNDTAADIKFIGRTIVDYGQDIAENQVHIMENFANTTQPLLPIAGQLWWDTNINVLKVYDGATFGTTGLENVVEDLTPQLGGNLDANGFSIEEDGNVILSFTSGGELAVNWIDVEHATTGSGPIIRSVGADTNIDLHITAKGTGIVNLGSGGVKLNAPLDVNGQTITNVGSFTIGGDVVLSFTTGFEEAANWVEIAWSELNQGPTISVVGAASNIDLKLDTKGTGDIDASSNKIVNVANPDDLQDVATKDYVDTTPGTGLENIVEDTTPQLGANLDVQSFAMVIDGGNIVLDYTSGGETAVNWIDVKNAATGFSPVVSVKGSDTDIDLVLDTKGTGSIDVSTNKIINVVDPTLAQDAATKTYVDDSIGFDLGEFTVAGLPTASSNANGYALATDASGGRTVVRSDGTDWKVVVVEGATVTV